MDIVKRLRHHKSSDVWDIRKNRAWAETDDLCMEAADEIERLREERNRLRKALQEIADSCEGWGQFAEDTLKEGE